MTMRQSIHAAIDARNRWSRADRLRGQRKRGDRADREGKLSLILLDLMMPDLNGDEVLKLIKSDPDKRDIPVVMISADTDVDKVRNASNSRRRLSAEAIQSDDLARADRGGAAQTVATCAGK